MHFLISGITNTDTAPKLLTGFKEDNVATFKTIGQYEQPKSLVGMSRDTIDQNRIELTYLLYKSINKIFNEQRIKDRIKWSLNCFINGLTDGHIYEKYRNYVRTIEAFILPEIGKTKSNFKSRTEIFVGPDKHELMGSIYDIRSSIEHLKNPLNNITGETNKEKYIKFVKYGNTVEYIARYCLNNYLLKEKLWGVFESDENIQEYWKKSDKEKSQNLGRKM